ncbi:MAG: hypothetical protein V1653_05410 [bacterium]
MKIKLALLTGLLVVLSSGLALAQEPEPGDLGVGIVLGEPTGVTGKMWIDDDIALDTAMAWSFEKKGYFHLHGDYLFHDPFSRLEAEQGKFLLYYGPGFRMKFSDDDKTRIALRVVGGLDYIFQDRPLDAFFEIAALVDVIPKTKADLNAGIGIRYYFH